MDTKQTYEQVHTATKEQTEELIGILENFGYRDVSVNYEVRTHGKKKNFPREHAADKMLHVFIEGTFTDGT